MRDSKPCWQKNLTQGFGCAEELLDFLQLPRSLAAVSAQQQFKTRVPRGFASRMQVGNPRDPLLLQVLAVGEELREYPDYTVDPLQEADVNPVPGLIHKYTSRVLLTLSGSCAVNCRYCFRRHFPYSENNPGKIGWAAALDYIAEDSRITEVILSGGDPLLQKDDVIAGLLSQISNISHVHTLRIHTRIPVVLPERITPDFLASLNLFRGNKVIVLHANHAQELSDEVKAACELLSHAGCYLLNQSVLLSGVNDNASVLAALSQRLFECGVLPYYLHLLDKVQGTAHFDVPLSQAKTIFQELQRLLPGYLVPRLAQEEAGKPHKTLL